MVKRANAAMLAAGCGLLILCWSAAQAQHGLARAVSLTAVVVCATGTTMLGPTVLDRRLARMPAVLVSAGLAAVVCLLLVGTAQTLPAIRVAGAVSGYAGVCGAGLQVILWAACIRQAPSGSMLDRYAVPVILFALLSAWIVAAALGRGWP